LKEDKSTRKEKCDRSEQL